MREISPQNLKENLSTLANTLRLIKWGLVLAVVLSGWVFSAWVYSSIKVPISPIEIQRTLQIEALPPEKGVEPVVLQCLDIVAQIPKEERKALSESRPPASQQPPVTIESSSDQQIASRESTPRTSDPGLSSTPNNQSLPSGVFPLNLGKFAIPASKDRQIYSARLRQDGTVFLQLEDRGGRGRFGGERYAFVDLSLDSSLGESFALGLHQDLGRIGRLEFMFESSGGVRRVQDGLVSDLDMYGALRLRVAFPF